ncbi:tRNA lysidine(34) synthetase TilS [Dysgonomonas sp. 520]|uniref:tRNA lysidine(34) synthetase TilS n=1 Tax=Dysgonomonas sp. 520 TaxID=2302931 RepID=UPI0013D67AB4|nr:tRNA lysidine(34) synthetase TilS [Dysgonomonas sp. 520]NDW09033.1 tRNA lysidine(34) synthetase TilS [Dysgonomonas sp. 520]
MKIQQKIKNFINENSLFPDGSKIIVGVSGGADSVALLDILHHSGYECVVAHCNFHLRGEESYRDEYFVEKLASKYHLTYVSTHFDTKKYVQDSSVSVEMAARELRYAWFEKIRKEYEAEYIAVAHHMDDSVETVLLNLIRGTGIRGLSGISIKNGYVVRPLLCITREEVLNYLEKKGLKYVTDSTNTDEVYTRNKIRLSVIPLLETINPSVKQTLARTAANLQQAENIYSSYIENAKSKVFVDNRIDILELMKFTEPKNVLFEILFPYGFNPPTVENIFDSIKSQSGKFFYSDIYRLVKDRNCFILEEVIASPEKEEYLIEESDTGIEKPINLGIERIENDKNFEIEKDKNITYLDAGKLKFPLSVRRWKHGDWFVPFGMKGKKKLSDYFTDKKYSIPEKENVWILSSGNKIIWIIGDRADNRFRITDETHEILKITLKK